MAGLKAPDKLFERDVGVAGAFCDVVVEGEGDGAVDRDVVTPLGGRS